MLPRIPVALMAAGILVFMRCASGAPDAGRAKPVLTYDKPLKYRFRYDHYRRAGQATERTGWFSATVSLKKVAATKAGDMIVCRVEDIEVCEDVRKLGTDTSSFEFKVGVDQNGKVRRVVPPDVGKLVPQRDAFRASLLGGITQTCFLELNGVLDLLGDTWNVQLTDRESVSGPNRAFFGRGMNGRKVVCHFADETNIQGMEVRAKVIVGRETGPVTSGLSVVAYVDTEEGRIVRASWVSRLPDRGTGAVTKANVFTAQLVTATQSSEPAESVSNPAPAMWESSGDINRFHGLPLAPKLPTPTGAP